MGAKPKSIMQSIITIIIAMFILLITAVSLVSASSLDFTNLEVRAEKCDEDGRLTFMATNKLLTPLSVHDFVIEARHKDTGTEFSPTSGTWTRESIHAATSASKSTIFTSEPGVLNWSGRYLFNVTYPGCRNQPCREHFDLSKCPGYEYSCEVQEATAKITKCEKKKDTFEIHFEGFNSNQFEQVDIPNEVFLYVDGNGRREHRVKYVEGKEINIQKGKKDAYVYSFTVHPNETIDQVGLSSAQCDGGAGSGGYVAWCTVPEEEKEQPQEIEDKGLDKAEEKETKKTPTRTKPVKKQTPTQEKTPEPQTKTVVTEQGFFTPVVIGIIIAIWVLLVVILIIVLVKLKD